eukprot:3202652-Ditylum_brightwellii.AAC.1
MWRKRLQKSICEWHVVTSRGQEGKAGSQTYQFIDWTQGRDKENKAEDHHQTIKVSGQPTSTEARGPGTVEHLPQV